jgi:hypothetical protein
VLLPGGATLALALAACRRRLLANLAAAPVAAADARLPLLRLPATLMHVGRRRHRFAVLGAVAGPLAARQPLPCPGLPVRLLAGQAGRGDGERLHRLTVKQLHATPARLRQRPGLHNDRYRRLAAGINHDKLGCCGDR